jgi:hypothetical protein
MVPNDGRKIGHKLGHLPDGRFFNYLLIPQYLWEVVLGSFFWLCWNVYPSVIVAEQQILWGVQSS